MTQYQGWTDELRESCRDRCAFYGDPPCFKMHLYGDQEVPHEEVMPCDDCMAGIVEK